MDSFHVKHEPLDTIEFESFKTEADDVMPQIFIKVESYDTEIEPTDKGSTKNKVSKKSSKRKEEKVRTEPITARGFFLKQRKEQSKEKKVDMKEATEVWNNMPPEEKNIYVEMSRLDKISLGENYRKGRKRKIYNEVIQKERDRERKKSSRAKATQEKVIMTSFIKNIEETNKQLVLNNEILVRNNEGLTKMLKEEKDKNERLQGEQSELQEILVRNNEGLTKMLKEEKDKNERLQGEQSELQEIKEKFKNLTSRYDNLKASIAQCQSCSEI